MNESYREKKARLERERGEDKAREDEIRRARCPEDSDGCGHPLVWHPSKEDRGRDQGLSCRGSGCACKKTREEILNFLNPIDVTFTRVDRKEESSE